MATTSRFHLDKFGGADGGAVTDNGGKFSTIDRDTLDRLLFAFEMHAHDADVSAQPLADPTGAPTGSVTTTGGTIPGGTTFYYMVSYVDAYGLETAASDELEVTTGAAPNVTSPPILNGSSVNGQTLPAGTYYYTLTALSAQGESGVGPQAIITVQPGQNGVLLTCPPMDNGITGYNVWRHGISDAGWTKVGVNVNTGSFTDVGVPTGTCLTDPATQPPSAIVAAAGTNSITVTVPDTALVGTLGGPVRAWRLYRSDASGNYGTEALVAETVPADDSTPLEISFLDTGGTALAGGPLLGSTTLTPSRRIFYSGTTLPSTTGYPDESLFLHLDEKAWYALLGGAWTAIGGSGGGSGGAYAYGAGPILTDANGGQWRLQVDTTGALSTVPASTGPGVDEAHSIEISQTSGQSVVNSTTHPAGDSYRTRPTWYTFEPTTQSAITFDTTGTVDSSGNPMTMSVDLYYGPAGATDYSQLSYMRTDSTPVTYQASAGVCYYVVVFDDAGTGSTVMTLNWSGLDVLPPAGPTVTLPYHLVIPTTDGELLSSPWHALPGAVGLSGANQGTLLTEVVLSQMSAAVVETGTLRHQVSCSVTAGSPSRIDLHLGFATGPDGGPAHEVLVTITDAASVTASQDGSSLTLTGPGVTAFNGAADFRAQITDASGGWQLVVWQGATQIGQATIVAPVGTQAGVGIQSTADITAVTIDAA